MQTDNKYIIHNQYTSFISPSTTSVPPNVTLRTFILDWVKEGRNLSPGLIAKAYEKKYGQKVSYQRVQTLIKKLGVKTTVKLRKAAVLIVFLILSSCLQLLLKPTIEFFRDLSLRHPSVHKWVYSNKVYAVEPTISVPEGVVETAQIASTSAGQTISAPTPSSKSAQIVREGSLDKRTHECVQAQPEIAAKLKAEFPEEQEYILDLVCRESSLRPSAINPSSGACGLFQALPCKKMQCELSDVDCQISWGKQYISSRYGTVKAAVKFHNLNGWY